jgi:hypothetical protein
MSASATEFNSYNNNEPQRIITKLKTKSKKERGEEEEMKQTLLLLFEAKM